MVAVDGLQGAKVGSASLTLEMSDTDTENSSVLSCGIPNYIWDPDTNKHVRDDGSADMKALKRKEKIAKEKQESLLARIPLVKLKLEEIHMMARGIVGIIPDTAVSQPKSCANLNHLLMESKLGGGSHHQGQHQLPAEVIAQTVVANLPVEGIEAVLWEEGNQPLITSQRAIDGVYPCEHFVWWFRDDQIIREFEFSEDSEIVSISHRDDRLFISLYDHEIDDHRGIWAKIKEDGNVRMFKSGFHDSMKLSALTPKRYLTNEYMAPLCLFASDGEVMHVYNNTNDPSMDLYEDTCEHYSDYESDSEDGASFDISELVYVDYPAYFETIVWAEYETKGNAPTAFATASNNDIVKIVFKDGDYDTFWDTLPGKSSIAVLKSHPSTKKLFAITHHGKMFTIDWTEDKPVLSPEIDLTRFWKPGSWLLQIVDEDTMWVGQEREKKVYLWSWKSPTQPLAVVDLKDYWLRDLQAIGSTCVFSIW